MYYYGLMKFMEYKKLHAKQCINAFLESEGITEFNHKNGLKVSNHIANNWTKFASFVDRGLKNGTLNGQRVKLNTEYDRIAEHRRKTKEEFESLNLSDEEELLLDLVYKEGKYRNQIHSFLNKLGLQPVKHNYDCHARKLRCLPLVKQAIEHGFMETLKESSE